MGVSADSVRLAIAPETVAGVMDAPPAFELLRSTGESVSFAYENTTSNELGGEGRGVRDSILTGGAVTGSINFELAKDIGFEDMMASLFGSAWGNDPLGIGIGADEIYVSDDRHTFTYEKTWDMGADAPDPYLYHRYYGCIADTCTLTITPNQPITGSFGLIGTTFDTDTDEAAGATYAPASTTQVMTAPLVTAITLLDDQGNTVFDVMTSCWTNLVINFASNNRAIPCIGTLGNRESVLGRFEVTIDYSVYFANDFMTDALKAQTDFKLIVSMLDNLGNEYDLEFPRVRVSTAEVTAGGTGQDVVVTGQMVGLVGADPDIYSAKLTRVAGGAPVETPLTALAAGAGASSVEVTITMGAGPATAAQSSLDVEITPDGGAAIPFSVALTEGDVASDVAAVLATEIDDDPNLAAVAVGEVVTVTPAGTTTNLTDATATIS